MPLLPSVLARTRELIRPWTVGGYVLYSRSIEFSRAPKGRFFLYNGLVRLTSIELSGFKSFAKKTELEFGADITAVVGPNGSGKSNIAESFRFVLGEQSMKS